ncbi:LysR family transcriptional regulator [Vibrio maerlii]|uniref:LysR family transcriptional regulator n=1 Tax=Vibrio maerlii TaxID=2231648 RepID=UPI000E3BB2F9|nr:LysR family transcriptional regulator [Vibrio maerlii]
MDLNLIVPFLRVYELNSITQAADMLGVTQPAMSASIKRLESNLDKPLFVRHGRRLEPTSDAHALATHFKEIEHQLELALDKPRQFKVYAPEHIVIQLPVLEDIQLIENPLSENVVLDHLRFDKIDMAIESRFKQEKQQAFIYEHLQSADLVYVCRQDHPTIGDSITMEQFSQLEHITLTYWEQQTSGVEKIVGHALPRKIVKQVTSPSSMLLCVHGSNAICATDKSNPLIELLGLKVIEIPFEIAPIQLDLVYHKKYQSNKQHMRTREFLRKYLS